MRFIDIYCPIIESIKVIDCFEIKKVELTDSNKLRSFVFSGFKLDQSLLHMTREQMINDFLSLNQIKNPIFIFHKF